MFGSLGMPELVIIMVLALIIFGPGKIPEMGSAIGKAIRGFKKSIKDVDEIPAKSPDPDNNDKK